MNNGWSLIAVEGEEKLDEGGLMWGGYEHDSHF